MFIVDLLGLVLPVSAAVTSKTCWMPRGYEFPDEAVLDSFGPKYLPGHEAWPMLRKWWLMHERGANTPNWDIAVGCEIEGRPGLILVEAKAHKLELKAEGKSLDATASQHSRDNHEQIGSAIRDACTGLQSFCPDTRIDRDTHYQLANRLAFTWKLASLGIPTVLVYLGFYGDLGIADVGPPFTDGTDWTTSFRRYADGTAPDQLFEHRLDVNGTPAWCRVCSRAVHEASP